MKNRIVTKLINMRTAEELLGKSMKEGTVESIPTPEVGAILTAHRLYFLAHEGKASQCRKELEAARKASPSLSLLALAEAVLESILSQKADSSERDLSLRKAATALLNAIEMDRSLLEEIHLLPELGPVRMSSTFRTGLKGLLQTTDKGQ
jgi:hypothetical protein